MQCCLTCRCISVPIKKIQAVNNPVHIMIFVKRKQGHAQESDHASPHGKISIKKQSTVMPVRR